MENKIIEIQNLLLDEMKRLNEKEGNEIVKEVQRSGALSKNAQEYMKAVGTSLKIKQMARQNKNAELNILKEVGVIDEFK